MSNLPAVIASSDMTEAEIVKVKKFMEDGLPGIVDVTSDKIQKMLDLYLNGSTYSQISNMLEVKKIFILYLAHIGNWEQMKRDYLNEIQEKIKSRVIDSKLRSQEFMLLLVQTWQKKIGSKLTRYLTTDDPSHMDSINLREIAQLMRAIEMINELDGEGRDKNGKTPAIGLNLGGGVVVEKTGNNKISITPKESTVGELLQQLADEKRNKEKTSERSDISINQGEKNEDNK